MLGFFFKEVARKSSITSFINYKQETNYSVASLDMKIEAKYVPLMLQFDCTP